jgi:hypothetical protein
MRYSREVHFDECFFDTAFSAAISFNDRRFEAHAFQTRYMGRHVAGGRGEISVIMTAAITLTRFVALISGRLCQLLGLLLQQLVESFFYASSD